VARSYQLLKLEDFSGGLNLRDAPSQVGDTEASDCMNVTCDERGGVVKRLGTQKYNATPIAGATGIKYMYFSDATNRMLAQVGTDLYATDGGGTWGPSIKTFTTTDRCHIVDFLKKAVIIHPVDGTFVYDGTTVGARVANSPVGDCIAVWQNALWTAGDPDQRQRLTRSDLGQITWPAAPITNDIRDRDDQRIKCLAFSQGLDTQGRPGLLVFKDSSTHRVHDSANGAYTTLSTDAGAGGSMCVASLYGYTAFLNQRGIYITDGLESPELVSGKIMPMFDPVQTTGSDAWWAGAYLDRFVFGIRRTTANTNDLLLEYHPGQGWIVPHTIASTAGTTWTKDYQRLYTGSGTNSYVFETFKGWADDGQNIAARWQSRWFEPTKGYEMRMRRLLVSGRGVYSLYVKHNYTMGLGILCPVSLLTSGGFGVWNEDKWNEFEWGPSGYEDYQQFFSLGHSRSVAFQIQESSQTSALGPSLLQDGASSEVGSFAMYGLHLDLVPLTPA
jgi:hypothetical protein